MIIAVRVIVILSLALTAHNRDQDLQCLNKTIAFLKREEILFFPMIPASLFGIIHVVRKQNFPKNEYSETFL